MAATDAFLESQPPKEIAKLVEIDVDIRRALQDTKSELLVFVHKT